MTWVTLINFKYEVFARLQKLKVKAENQSGQKLKILKIDGGGEYNYTELKTYYEDNGIQQDVIAPYTRQHDGLS